MKKSDFNLEYKLLDTGNFRKLEQVGPWKLIRPALNACWNPMLSKDDWLSADAEFLRDSSGHGKWKVLNRPLPENWVMRWGNFNLHIKPTSFGHLGFFAEQYQNWEFFEKIIPTLGKDVKTMNLFAYSGIGSMAIFGSYIGKERALMGEAIRVAVLDTFVAISSGLIIFPACFAYGVQPDSGPSLIFITLPNIFNNIPMGRLWGTLFFVFMTFAAFSTVLAVFENILSCTADLFGWDRKKGCLINGIAMIIMSMPCILGFNVLSNIQPLGPGSGIMDLEDFIVSNLLLPGGSLIYVLFCVTRYGWGWDNFVKEANEGQGLKVAQWMRPYMTFVLPIIVLIIGIMGLI